MRLARNCNGYKKMVSQPCLPRSANISVLRCCGFHEVPRPPSPRDRETKRWSAYSGFSQTFPINLHTLSRCHTRSCRCGSSVQPGSCQAYQLCGPKTFGRQARYYSRCAPNVVQGFEQIGLVWFSSCYGHENSVLRDR